MNYKFIILRKYFLIFYYTLFDIVLISFLFLFSTNKLNTQNLNFTIVTASDTSHFLSLKQLITSIIKFEPKANLIVYDLGLSKDELIDLKQNFNNINIKKFRFEEYPEHVHLSSQDNGAYAWKPIIINETINSVKGTLIWMDAGNVITKNLRTIKKYIKIIGFYSPLSSENIKKWSHPRTLSAINFPKTDLNKRNLNAAIVGINYNSKYIDLISKWKELSLDKEFILPDGANITNHRWDQTLLTLLFYKEYKKLFFLRTYNVFGIRVHQDID